MDNPSNNDLEDVTRCDGVPYPEQDLMEKILNKELAEVLCEVSDLKKTFEDQKIQLQEMESLYSLKAEVASLKRKEKSLLARNSLYGGYIKSLCNKIHNQEMVIADRVHHISEMQNKFDLEKQSALEDRKDTVEEQWKHKLDKLTKELSYTQCKLASQVAKLSSEPSLQKTQLEQGNVTQLQETIVTTRDMLREEKREWECSMKNKMEKEQDEFKKSFREAVELELKESKRDMEMKISQVKQACRRVQRLAREAIVEEVDAKVPWQEAPGKDLQQRKERNICESNPISRNDEYKRKLNLAINEMQRVLDLPRSCITKPLEKYKEEID